MKELTKGYWENLLKDNFTNKEIEILHNEIKNPQNELMQSILKVKFKKLFL